MDISTWIQRNAEFHPHKPAIEFNGECLSYAQMFRQIHGFCAMLQDELGLVHGDRIGWLGYNHPHMLCLLFACARLGLVLVPLNWRLTVAEHAYILENAGIRKLFTDGEFETHCSELLQAMETLDLIQTSEIDPAAAYTGEIGAKGSLDSRLLLVYTSGTTGHPKGAVLRQRALLTNAQMSLHMHDMTSADVIYTCLPMFHVGGLNIQTTPALYCGATIVLSDRFEPTEFLLTMRTRKPSLVVMVPAVMQAVLSQRDWAADTVDSLRCLTTGSSVVPVSLIEQFENCGVQVLQVYGSTETCPIAVYQRINESDHNIASTGRAGLLCELRLADSTGKDVPAGASGEILIRGDQVLSEYWNNAEATRESFHQNWFRTGDIGLVGEDGCLVVVDRAKDVIISGGENIYPAELERVLHSHPAVIDVAVVGGPDAHWGEVPVAFVHASEALEAEDLLRYCRDQLARYKLPREFRFVESFPRTSLGKVQKFQLRQLLVDEHGGS